MNRREADRADADDVERYLAAFAADQANRAYRRTFECRGVTVTLVPGVFPSDSPLTLTTESTLDTIEDSIRKGEIAVGQPIRLLDLGCGSGIVALYLKKVLAQAHVVAADRDPCAVAVTQENVAMSSSGVEVRKSDLFSNLPERFDLIVCTLSYVEAWRDLQVTPPRRAKTVERFWRDAPAHLKTGGKVFFNWVSWAEFGMVEDLATAAGFRLRWSADYPLRATGYVWRTYVFDAPAPT